MRVKAVAKNPPKEPGALPPSPLPPPLAEKWLRGTSRLTGGHKEEDARPLTPSHVPPPQSLLSDVTGSAKRVNVCVLGGPACALRGCVCVCG